MEKPEWIPVNPYPQDTYEHKNWYIAYELGSYDALEKLLEYQLIWRRNPNLTIPDFLTRVELMLEQLRVKK